MFRLSLCCPVIAIVLLIHGVRLQPTARYPYDCIDRVQRCVTPGDRCVYTFLVPRRDGNVCPKVDEAITELTELRQEIEDLKRVNSLQQQELERINTILTDREVSPATTMNSAKSTLLTTTTVRPANPETVLVTSQDMVSTTESVCEDGLYEYNFEEYDIDGDDQVRDRTPCSWFPYENDNKRVCFVKIVVEGVIGRFKAVSHSGNRQYCNVYGSRIDSTKPVHGYGDNTSVLCIEVKCSGAIRVGDAFDDNHIGDDNTVVEITPIDTCSKCTVAGEAMGLSSELETFLVSHNTAHTITITNSAIQFELPSVNIPDYRTGIYVGTGEGREGYDDAYKNCYAGHDTAYFEPDFTITPDAPAVTYTCE